LPIYVDIRTITVGHIHAERGDPAKVAAYHRWLMDHPGEHMFPLDVRAKPNGTYRIHDGRHRFLAYVLAERPTVPIVVGRPASELLAY
jgi:ParB-like nuclease domain